MFPGRVGRTRLGFSQSGYTAGGWGMDSEQLCGIYEPGLTAEGALEMDTMRSN